MLGAIMLRPFALALRAAHTSDVLLPPGISFPVFWGFFGIQTVYSVLCILKNCFVFQTYIYYTKKRLQVKDQILSLPCVNIA